MSLASEFKLFVLGALADQVATGQVRWNQQLTVETSSKAPGIRRDPDRSRFSLDGTKVSVQRDGDQEISISDNTAADMLINLVGRSAVESQVQHWSSTSELDSPFLTTPGDVPLALRRLPALANAYLNRTPSAREAFLELVGGSPLTPAQVRESTEPRAIDNIEWFGSPDDICRAFVGLQQLSRQPKLSPNRVTSSRGTGAASGSTLFGWPTVWFKGGSEPGVLTLGYLATNSKGQAFVVSAMLSNAHCCAASFGDAGSLGSCRGRLRTLGLARLCSVQFAAWREPSDAEPARRPRALLTCRSALFLDGDGPSFGLVVLCSVGYARSGLIRRR